MKKIRQLFCCMVICSLPAITSAQLTGIKNIPGDYATLSLAITTLNAQGVGAGGVTLNLLAGNPQTTPSGGYVIGNTGNILVGATNPSAANPVIIEGNSNTITASSSQSFGSLTDGIFKLIGADYITIRHFTMQENAANTGTTGIVNDMTEWGVALLHVSLTDGAQNNTIRENTISLNRAYRNTFAVYSNVRHSATDVTFSEAITNSSGSNSGNKIYTNNIGNTDYGVLFVGATDHAYMDIGNDIGGSSTASGNTITNWGGNNTALSAFISITTASYCIYIINQVNDNVSYNSITSAAISGGTFDVGAILQTYSSLPSIIFSSTLNNNTITLTSSNLSGNMYGVNVTGSLSGSLSTINIRNNTIVNCVYTAGSFVALQNSSVSYTTNITGNIIKGISTSSPGSFIAISNIGGYNSTISNNQVGNASAAAITFSMPLTGAITVISNNNNAASSVVNINSNSVEGISAVSAASFTGIGNSGGAGIININNNLFGTSTGNFVSFSAVQAGTLFGITNGGGASNATLTIQGNDFRRIVHSVTGSGNHQYITSTKNILSQNVIANTFTNLSVNTTGSAMASGATWTCSNNSIVTAFNKTASGGYVQFLAAYGSSANGSVMTETGNNFSNVTVTGNTQILCWENIEGQSNTVGPTKTITGNTFSNITSGTNGFYGFFLNYGNAINCSSNTFSNITCAGLIITIFSFNNAQGIHNYSDNNISGLSSTGIAGNIFAIVGDNRPTWNISNNIISGLSTTGASSSVGGVQANSGLSINIHGNTISNLTGTGNASPIANGISVLGGTTVSVYQNNIYNISETAAISTTSPAVTGLILSGSTNVTAYNNFISDLKAPAASFIEAIRGIEVSATGANTSYDLYNNSVYVNATSTGTNFGTSGIYHVGNATATTAKLSMINNIIVNTSTPKGTGVTAAYRRSNATLTNYASTADYNLLYAGTPAANKLIFYDGTNSDQTLGIYKTRVSARDANSMSVMPNFIAANDLHLTADNCSLDNMGTPVAGVTNDIDADTRSVTVPDIGADEFTAYNISTLAGVVSAAVCINKAVANTGTLYKDAGCNRIAKIIPSGADPVTGMINTCVTLDVAQLYFNGEPYVQRHYDIEPASSNQTTTSATITLYFTDAEFALYNSSNAAWPALPTTAGGGNSDPNIANLKVTQFHGVPTGGLPTSTPGNYTGLRVLLVPVSIILNSSIWEVTINISGFSGFYVHSNDFNTALPITINYFTGIKQNGNHLLNWKVTCISTPSATIEMERSTDGRSYNSIYSILATALRCQQPFDYTDNQPVKGINYYRLKITDASGKITYSTIVSLINTVKGIDVMNIAPNPIVNGTFNLEVSTAEKIQMEVVITDMQGRILQKRTVLMIAGFNSIPMNVRNLAAGTYQLFGNTADGRTRVLRFVIQ